VCYKFYIVFVKCIQCYIVPHVIVQMGLPVDGVCIHSPKQDSFEWLAAKQEENAVEANLLQQSLQETLWQVWGMDVHYFIVYGTISDPVTWRVSGSLNMPFQQYSTNWDRLISPNESAVWWRNWIENGYVWTIIG